MSNTRIELIIGPMFSGKSTELLRRTSRYEAIGKRVLLINHTKDSRTDNQIQTHSNHTQQALKVSSLVSLLDMKEYTDADVIGIDESQFFEDLLDFISIGEYHNKIFIISGLDGDYKRRPIGQILMLIPLCDSVVKLTSLDMMDKDGSAGLFTKRIGNSDQLVLIGAENEYLSVNRKNYLYYKIKY